MLRRSLAADRRDTGFRAWWCRHDGVDGAIRVGGAVAVVATIELLAGYFLWHGMTALVGVPDVLGWTLQVGLAGGSAVGTRAFHRGCAEDKWWGLATSVFAVACLVVDASAVALLLHGLLDANPGALAVGVLVECLIVGYLTVHTLMARPRRIATAPIAKPESWGPPAAVSLTKPAPQTPAPQTPAAPKPTAPPARPRVATSKPPKLAPVPAAPTGPAAGRKLSSTQRLRAQAKARGITQKGKKHSVLRAEIAAYDAREQVPA